MINLITKLRPIIYRLFSENIIRKFLSVYSKLFIIYSYSKLREIQNIFNNAPDTPGYLGWSELKYLQNKYQFPFSKQKISNQTIFLSKKGEKKAIKLMKLIKSNNSNYKRFLELGCNEGMVCYHLQSMGKTAVGIDIKSTYFDERAIKKNIELLEMDARDLKFEEESFDMVFSFDCFEHFPNPDKVLEEAIRVLRKGGLIYILFSLPYMSPYGLHAFKTITVPYCQHLFPMKVIRNFAKNLKGVRSLPEGDFPLNMWSTEDFRKLWKKYSNKIKIIKYKEIFDISYIKLIKQYPSCFKSKTDNFDNLIVTSIEVIFKKIS